MCMEQHFSVEQACEYGPKGAVAIRILRGMVLEHKDRGENEHDGRTWVRLRAEDLKERMPYFTREQLVFVLGKLRDRGVLRTGRWGHPFDRSLWYAFEEEARMLAE